MPHRRAQRGASLGISVQASLRAWASRGQTRVVLTSPGVAVPCVPLPEGLFWVALTQSVGGKPQLAGLSLTGVGGAGGARGTARGPVTGSLSQVGSLLFTVYSKHQKYHLLLFFFSLAVTVIIISLMNHEY